MKNTKILGVIPARFGSTRFPGKPLADIWGKPMIRHVYERCVTSNLFNDVVIATDDQRIADEVKAFGGKVMLTKTSHESGTDRCAEVLARCKNHYDVLVNIQGDEPFVNTNDLAALIALFTNKHVTIGTLITPIKKVEDLFNPNKVKVVLDNHQKALYFSRSAIPHQRGKDPKDWQKNELSFKHLGVYAYRTDVLAQLSMLSVNSLEQTEGLEQLRWLANGFSIYAQQIDSEIIAVDTPEDLTNILKNDALKSLYS